MNKMMIRALPTQYYKQVGVIKKKLEAKLMEIAEFKRQYTTIKVSIIDLPNTFSIMLQNQKNLRELELVHVTFSSTQFSNLLNNLLMLEKIHLENIDYQNEQNNRSSIPSVTMSALKSLTLKSTSMTVVASIGETPALEKLLTQRTRDNSCQQFLSFLHRQISLKYFKFDEHQSNDVITTVNIPKFTFKLEKLKISDKDADGQTMIAFLESQEQSLKHLKISKSKPAIFKHVFKNMKLETLEIRDEFPNPDHLMFFDDCRENPFLRHLKLTYVEMTADSARVLFKIYKNIETVKIAWYDDDEAECQKQIPQLALDNLPKLEHLYVCCEIQSSMLSSDTLKSLQVKCSFINHLSIVMKNLESLTIIEDVCIDSATIDCCLPNLQTLVLNMNNLRFSQDLLEEIKVNCPKLHTIRLGKGTSIDDRVIEAREEKVRIYFFPNSVFQGFVPDAIKLNFI
jgi:hypothetical protein